MGRPDLSQVDQLVDLRGAKVVDSAGENIGSVEQIWVDNTDFLPEWAAVRVGRGPRTEVRLVPLRAADFEDGQVQVNYTGDEVVSAPEIDPDASGHDEMERLYRHFRQPLPAPPPPRVRNPFDRMTATWVPGIRGEGGVVRRALPAADVGERRPAAEEPARPLTPAPIGSGRRLAGAP